MALWQNVGKLHFTRPSDSGNFKRAEQDPECEDRYKVYICSDNEGSVYERGFRMWYFFAVCGGNKGDSFEFEIMNLNPMLELYNRTMKPVHLVSARFCENEDVPIVGWETVPGKVSITRLGNAMRVKFQFTFPQSNTVAYFCPFAPFSYSQTQRMLCRLENVVASKLAPKDIYFVREHLVNSLDGNRVDLLTISSQNGKGTEDDREEYLPNLFPTRKVPRPHRFRQKQYVFISCRVHPGENQASYCLRGVLRYLTSATHCAKQLRDIYVFKILPMLNPDGVRRGNYRCNSRGENLNRMYLNPLLKFHPTIYAWKEVIRVISKWELSSPHTHTSVGCKNGDNQIVVGKSCRENERVAPSKKVQENLLGSSTKQMVFFLDMHGHAMRPGCYVMSTSAPGFGPLALKNQALKYAFAKLMDQKSSHFTFDACSFGTKRCKKKRFSTVGTMTPYEIAEQADRKLKDADAMKDWKRIKEEAALLSRTMNDSNKDGTGRVVVADSFGVVHSYTLEASANVSPASQSLIGHKRRCYSAFEYEAVGKALCETLLDLNSTVANIPGKDAPKLSNGSTSNVVLGQESELYSWAKKQSFKIRQSVAPANKTFQISAFPSDPMLDMSCLYRKPKLPNFKPKRNSKPTAASRETLAFPISPAAEKQRRCHLKSLRGTGKKTAVTRPSAGKKKKK